MTRRPIWFLALLLIALVVGACTDAQREARSSADPELLVARLAVEAVDVVLTKVAAADAEAVADPSSPEHAAALTFLDELDRALRAAQEALATLPRGDHPELRDQLAALVDDLVELVADLRSRVEAGDVAGIQAAIDAARALGPEVDELEEEIDEQLPRGFALPSEESSAEPTTEPEPSAEPTTEPTPMPNRRGADARTDADAHTRAHTEPRADSDA